MVDRKGLIQQISTMLIMMVVFAGIAVFIFILVLLVPPITESSDIITDIVGTAFQGNSNATFAYNQTFVPVNKAIQNFEWISSGLIIMSLFGFVMCCFFVRTYPFLLFMWIGFIVVMAFVGILISNSYEGVRGGLGYTSFELQDYLTLYFPHIIVVFGIISGFVLLVILAGKPNEGEVVN